MCVYIPYISLHWYGIVLNNSCNVIYFGLDCTEKLANAKDKMYTFVLLYEYFPVHSCESRPVHVYSEVSSTIANGPYSQVGVARTVACNDCPGLMMSVLPQTTTRVLGALSVCVCVWVMAAT